MYLYLSRSGLSYDNALMNNVILFGSDLNDDIVIKLPTSNEPMELAHKITLKELREYVKSKAFPKDIV